MTTKSSRNHLFTWEWIANCTRDSLPPAELWSRFLVTTEAAVLEEGNN